MGKRKTKRKAAPKRQRQKLDVEFNCPICFADKTVEVHLNHKTCVASTFCRSCRTTYETSITPIDAEIDVYSNWIDAVEDGTAPQQSVLADNLAAIPESATRRKTPSSHTARARQEGTGQASVEEEDEDDAAYAEAESIDDDEYGYVAPRPPAAPPAPEEEIELPDEEEEYDFGDNNDDEEDDSTPAADNGNPPSWDQG